MVWGYAPIGLAANSARDLGGRFAALTLFGRAASGGNYAALASLTNIPATLLAGVFYVVQVLGIVHAERSGGAPAGAAR